MPRNKGDKTNDVRVTVLIRELDSALALLDQMSTRLSRTAQVTAEYIAESRKPIGRVTEHAVPKRDHFERALGQAATLIEMVARGVEYSGEFPRETVDQRVRNIRAVVAASEAGNSALLPEGYDPRLGEIGDDERDDQPGDNGWDGGGGRSPDGPSPVSPDGAHRVIPVQNRKGSRPTLLIEKLEGAIKERGITQLAITGKLGLPEDQVTNWIRGTSKTLTAHWVLRIAEILDVDLAYLMDDDVEAIDVPPRPQDRSESVSLAALAESHRLTLDDVAAYMPTIRWFLDARLDAHQAINLAVAVQTLSASHGVPMPGWGVPPGALPAIGWHGPTTPTVDQRVAQREAEAERRRNAGPRPNGTMGA